MNIIILTLVSLVLLLSFSRSSVLACTLLGASSETTTDGNVYIGSTSDNNFLMGPRKPVVLTIPKDGYKFIHTPCLTLTEEGTLVNDGSDRGMNEKGFSWTRSWVVPKEVEDPDKMKAEDWFIKMGSNVANVDEAIEFVKSNPKGVGCQGNYIFADADNNIAVVEVSYFKVTVVEKYKNKEKGLIARANRWESKDMKALDDSNDKNKMYFKSSSHRYETAMDLLNKYDGKIDVSVLKNILANKATTSFSKEEHGFGINNYGRVGGTVSAEIYDPVNRIFWYTYGWTDDSDLEIDEKIYGKNINSWKGQWIPFDLNKMEKEGYYTNWDGGLTNLGIEYLMNLNNKY